MDLICANNHIILCTEYGEYLLIDTGCPHSFSFKKDIEVDLDGKCFMIREDKSLSNCFYFHMRVVELTGLDIDGFIGLDIISQTNLTIDFVKEQVYFKKEINENARYTIPFERNPYIVVRNNIVMNKNTVLPKVIIDTGAYISYVDDKYINEENKTKEYYIDYNFKSSDYEGYYYNELITVKGNEFMISESDQLDSEVVNWLNDHHSRVGKMEIIYKGIADAFLNPRVLSQTYVCFDFKEMKIYLGI